MSFERLVRRLLAAIPTVLGVAAGAGLSGTGLVNARHVGTDRLDTGYAAPAPPLAEAIASVTAPLAAADQPTLRTPGQSLPVPVHNEATCAFCQAAIFSPCAPQPTGISIEATCLVQHERAAPQAARPHSTSHRPTSSRAPPPLRSA